MYLNTLPQRRALCLILSLYISADFWGCDEADTDQPAHSASTDQGSGGQADSSLNDGGGSADEEDSTLGGSELDERDAASDRDMMDGESLDRGLDRDAGVSQDQEVPSDLLYDPDDGPSHDGGRVVSVSSSAELLSAIEMASPGDVITLMPGDYPLNQLITVRRAGTAAERIFLRAEELGQVTLSLSHIENFKLYAPFWVFENLKITGVCEDGRGCEHAFHIVGDADDLIFRDNEIIDFASHVKLNGERTGEGPAQSFPDRVMFLNNLWYNTRYITNNAPHNILNLDGGRDHVIRGNIFADYNTPETLPKSASAVYLKASTRGALVEQNLIVCEWTRTAGETARGVQLGDGAPASICDGDDDQDGIGDCEERGQSQETIVRNNIIARCDNGGSAAGIMVSSDRDSLIIHNTVYHVGQRNAGFYQGHPDHDTYWRANILERGINTQYANRPLNERDNLSPSAEEVSALFTDSAVGDLTLQRSELLMNQVETASDAPHDFCGYPRGERADIGAIEYSTTYEGARCVEQLRAMFARLP